MPTSRQSGARSNRRHKTGISEYSDPSIPSLRYAASDAKSASEAFFRACEFDRKGSKVLSSKRPELASDKFDLEDPTSEKIYAALSAQRRQGEREAFAFYFSGHGFRS